MLLFSADQKSTYGTGFGLFPDFVFSSVMWTLIQVVFFYWPDLSHIKKGRNAELDFRNRMVSFIHGIVIFGLSLHQMIVEE